MNKKGYVVCICPRYDEFKILLIEKNRPEWQAGRINFPGGSIEEGETPEQAAVRELKEESGLIADISRSKVIGVVDCPDCVVHCVMLLPENGAWWHDDVLNPDPDETEKVFWEYAWTAVRDKRILNNLKVIIPLVMYGVDDFKIIHENNIENEFKVII